MKNFKLIAALAIAMIISLPAGMTYASTVSGNVNGTVVAQEETVDTSDNDKPRRSGGGGRSGGSSTLKGDINKDGKVDIQDFVQLMANWGKKEAGNAADLNKDGNVDILDFVIIMSNWTK